jgi:hypothetical protein
MPSNCRIHLTRWAVTAPAEKHRGQDHHHGLPGPRRPQLAGDANVRWFYPPKLASQHWLGVVVLLVTLVNAFGISAGPSHAEDFVVPGILTHAPFDSCTILNGDYYGTYYLENYGAFSIGDTVVVIASRKVRDDCNHRNTFDLLLDNEIWPIRGFDFGCGRLYVEEEYGCGFLITDRFGWVALVTHHGFSSGDSIHVTGDLMLDCTAIPECAGALCVYRNAVTTCVTPIRASSWGSIRSLFR